MRLTGSFQTITIHGLSVSVSSSSSGSWTSIGAVTAARSCRRRPQLLGDAAQEAVDEAAGVLGRVLLGQLDRLADHDRARDLGLPPELVGGQPEDGAVDRGHALERPVLRELAQQRVDVGVVLLDPTHEPLGVLVGRRRLLLDQRVDAELTNLELVTEAQ